MEVDVEIVTFSFPFKDMKYNTPGTNAIGDIMEELGLEYEHQEVAAGSSDIGNVSYACPAFHPTIAITNEDIALHTKEFAEVVKSNKSEDAIKNGSKLITYYVDRLVSDSSLLSDIKEDFEG